MKYTFCVVVVIFPVACTHPDSYIHVVGLGLSNVQCTWQTGVISEVRLVYSKTSERFAELIMLYFFFFWQFAGSQRKDFQNYYSIC